jgi:hypothetical protein
LLAIVRVADWISTVTGVKLTWNGKQKSGLITTGKPEVGVVMVNCGSDDVMELTSRSAFPVLQTFSVAVLVVLRVVSGKFTPPGTWISGTSPTRNDEKKMSMLVEGGIIDGGEADAQAV